MTPARDVWQAALAMVRKYGDRAMLEADRRPDQLQDDDDWECAFWWHRILNAIERLQGRPPAEDEKVH